MNILLVDDEQDSRGFVAEFLSELGHNVIECSDGHEALSTFPNYDFHLVLTDIKMPGMNGIQLLQKIKRLPLGQAVAIILFTGYGDLQSALAAMRAGAYDYLLKPINVEELALLTERIAEYQLLRKENKLLTEKFEDAVNKVAEETKQELSRYKQAYYQTTGISKVKFFSASMGRIFEQAQKLHVNSSVPVLIEGETGTGKEVIARLVHYGNSVVTSPFVDINCAALTPNIFESELFGYEPGAFTGGLPRGQKGKLDLAQGGTILLDEIGEIPVELQAKLLRVIQEREYFRVGGLKKIKADIRIICTTNLCLQQQVARGAFRKDLYYRLNIGHIQVPPLRDRTEEIIPLAEIFLKQFARDKGKKFNTIGKDAAAILLAYPWPGNVRELKNTMERVTLMWDGLEVEPRHLNLPVINIPAALPDVEFSASPVINHEDFTLPPRSLPLDDYMHNIIQKALQLHGGNKTKTAQYLGISRRSLYCRLK